MIRARLVLAGALAVAALAAAPAANAVQWEQLPAPTNLHALHVSDTAADLDWLSSSLGNGDVLQRKVNGRWQEWDRGLYGFKELTGLRPGTTYTVRVYTLGNAGLWTLTSPYSAPLAFTTLAAPDSQPPARPATPTFSSIGTAGASLFWPETTDNVEVTGYYLDQLVGGVWTTLRTTDAYQRSQGVNGLSPATSYTFGVRAFDARGNVSERSAPGTFTTKPLTAQPSCDVQQIRFTNGFYTTVTVTNSTATAITGWSITAHVPTSATLSSSFGGVYTRTGETVTITPATWNTTIAAGGGTSTGFTGTSPLNEAPSDFAFNGIPCSLHS